MNHIGCINLFVIGYYMSVMLASELTSIHEETVWEVKKLLNILNEMNEHSIVK